MLTEKGLGCPRSGLTTDMDILATRQSLPVAFALADTKADER
jgi:hypothetical protein